MSSGPGAVQMRGATPGAAARRGRNSVAVTGINYTPGLTALQTAKQSTICQPGDVTLVTATQRASISAVEDAAAAEAARLERERARTQMQRELDEVFRVSDTSRKEFPHSKIVGSYLIGRTLGEGAFAKVRLALHHPSGQQVAVKVVSKEKVKQDAYMAKHFRRESKLQQMLAHPNIVRVYEVLETERFLYFVQELCEGGDLVQLINARGRLSERETRHFMRQLLAAVDHMHRAGILHRDLKAENFLLTPSNDLKVTDFGLSTSYLVAAPAPAANAATRSKRASMALEAPPAVTQMRVQLHTQCGSPAYAAPEVLAHEPYCTEADVWSLGVNMFYMLAGQLPYMVEPFSMRKLLAKIRSRDIAPLPLGLSADCVDLLNRLLNADRHTRITIYSALQHPWVTHDGPVPLLSISKARLVSEMNRTVLRYMSNSPFPKLVPCLQQSAANAAPGPQATQANVTCTLSYIYPNAAEVMAAVSHNQPHELTALYHLLLLRLETHCAARGTSLEDFERRFSAALELASRPPPTLAPPAAAAATPATHVGAPHTPILPPPAGGPLPKTQRADASAEQQLAPLVGPEEPKPPPQPAGEHPPVERRLTPLKEDSAEKEAAVKVAAEPLGLPLARQKIPTPFLRSLKSSHNATPAAAAVGMDRSLYVEGSADAKAFHFIDENESRVERDGVNAGGLVGVHVAERRSEENAGLGVVRAVYSRNGPTATPPLIASKFSQMTQSPHYSSQTVSSRARSNVAGALSLADEQAVESAAAPTPAVNVKVWSNERFVSQQPLLELQSSPRSSQTRSDEKLQYYPKLAKAKDKARTLPHANAGSTPGRARGAFALFKFVNDGSKSARGVAAGHQLTDGRLGRPKTAIESLPH